MKKYTFTGLLNTIIRFEEELSKLLSEKGFMELAEESVKRRERLREVSNVIIVEMTLEPIYTIDFWVELDKIRKYKDPIEIRKAINDVYREVVEAVEPVSMEFANQLKSFI
ncbi:TPA: hypothetical protein EYP83_03140 [Candidatus Geothermarchaeota archaeon]|nr:hypothetical protein [Candidatus Geothermarchaeota archaeon]